MGQSRLVESMGTEGSCEVGGWRTEEVVMVMVVGQIVFVDGARRV